MLEGTTSLADALTQGLEVIKDGMELFTTAPAIYFVALALIGAGAGVARKFVPMRRR